MNQLSKSSKSSKPSRAKKLPPFPGTLEIIYTLVLYPLIFAAFYISSFFNDKVRLGFKLRKESSSTENSLKETFFNGASSGETSPTRKNSAPCIWFHVASGELEYAKPVIRQLKAQGDYRILVTFFSPSVLGSLRNTPEIDLFVPMPWDTPWHWRKFIARYQPRCLAIARTDIWPQMIWQTSHAKIPSLLFSATLPKQSGRVASFWGRLLYGSLLENMTHISCVAEADFDNFQTISSALSVEVDGDTRFDQVLHRLQNKKHVEPLIETYVTEHKSIFVVGSSWPEDEEQILPALYEPMSQGMGVLIAPHEPSAAHIEDLCRKLRAQNITPLLYSELSSRQEKTSSFEKSDFSEISSFLPFDSSKKTDMVSQRESGKPLEGRPNEPYVSRLGPGRVAGEKLETGPEAILPTAILIDKVGILAELYAFANVSFVGGSFKKTVHSVMEPAACGNQTLFGPLHQNNREAIALRALGLGREIQNSSDLKKILLEDLSLSSSDRLKRKDQVLAFVKQNTGVSQKITGWLREHTENNVVTER